MKSIWSSKTMWAAVISEIIALLTKYGETNIIDAHTLAVVLPLLFGFLRLMTSEPVVVTPPTPPQA